MGVYRSHDAIQDEDTTSSALGEQGKAEETATSSSSTETVASPPAIHPNLLEPQPEKEEDTLPDVMKVGDGMRRWRLPALTRTVMPE